jgi:hypothetical protein
MKRGLNYINKENNKDWKKICLSTILFTTNPTLNYHEENTELRCERSSTKVLSHDSDGIPRKQGFVKK